MAADELIPIAYILRPQGRKGEVLAELLTDVPDQFRADRTVLLAKHDEATGVQHTVEDHWLPVGKNAGRVVLKLSDVNSISEAELLSSMDVLIPAAELPALEEDTFYVRDLVGCTLLNGIAPVGTIIDLQFATSPDGRVRLEDAPPLLVIEIGPEVEPVLVPFAKAYLETVDIAAKKVTMHLPEGLLDEPPSSETNS